MPDGVIGDYFSPRRPRVIAHRGLALEAPENTLLAFAKALAVGVEHIETDVHASRDGHAIVSHDPDLSRLAGRRVRVSELTLEELREVPLGAGQRFCTLAEALDGFPETRFNIDIKSADAVLPTVRAIVAQRATQRVLVTSFSERRRRAAIRRLPGVATSASAFRFAVALLLAKLGLIPLLRWSLRGISALQIPERAIGLRTVTPRMVRRYHSAGVEVHVWTINDPAAMERLLDAGVDGIVTDRADLARAVVDARF